MLNLSCDVARKLDLVIPLRVLIWGKLLQPTRSQHPHVDCYVTKVALRRMRFPPINAQLYTFTISTTEGTTNLNFCTWSTMILFHAQAAFGCIVPHKRQFRQCMVSHLHADTLGCMLTAFCNRQLIASIAAFLLASLLSPFRCDLLLGPGDLPLASGYDLYSHRRK